MLNGKVISTTLLSRDTYDAMARIVVRGGKGGEQTTPNPTPVTPAPSTPTPEPSTTTPSGGTTTETKPVETNPEATTTQTE